MDRYIIAQDNSENTLKTIHTDFKDLFDIDLDDRKYRAAKEKGIEKVWSMISKDIFGKEPVKMCWEYADDFMGLFETIINDKNANVTDTDASSDKVNAENIFASVLEDYHKLPEKYDLYAGDVWVDAYFTIKYIELGSEQSDNDNDKINSKFIYMEEENCYLPFGKKDATTKFCESLKTAILQKPNAFKIKKYIDNAKSSWKPSDIGLPGISLNIEYQYDRDFTRWSYEKISELYNPSSFKMEDSILFHKIFNDIFIKNVLYVLERERGNLSDYRLFLYSVWRYNSFSWQIFVAVFYIKINTILKSRPQEIDLKKKIRDLLYWWMTEAKEINRIENTLARGLFYVYWNYGYYIKEPSLMDETKALTVMGDKVNEYLEYLQKYDLDFESTLRETDGTESEKSPEYTKRKSRQYRFVTISNSMDWNFVFLQMEYFNYASRVNNREEFPFVLPLSLDEKKVEDKD